MNAVDLAVLNLKETRRRSIQLWRALPDEWCSWRPDAKAFSFGEMIRHVWNGSYELHMIMKHGGDCSAIVRQPYETESITSVEREIELSQPYFERFISWVASLKAEDLTHKEIVRTDTDVEQRSSLGAYLMLAAYHDATHTGQFLQYLRMAGLERPNIWD